MVKAEVDAASTGQEVNLPQFGKLNAEDMPERTLRNLLTGEAITIEALTRPAFTLSKALKSRR